MNLKVYFIILIAPLFIIQESKSAEKIYLYKGTFSRIIQVKELEEFKKTKRPNDKLKSLIRITNQNKESLHKALSYEIDIPLATSSKLMNSKIGKVFLARLTKIIYPNKISDINIGIKAIRSGILVSSFNRNEKINLIDFFKAYPNKNIAIDLNVLSKALKKAESLKKLIEFYSNSPFKKLKDGSSRI